MEGPQKKIVIVEDSATQAIKLKFLLESKNFSVFHAKDGEEALKLIQDNQPDIIISDVIMPGLNGFELTKKLKESSATKNIPIILVTSLISLSNILEGLESGADNYITKPYDDEDLLSKISKELDPSPDSTILNNGQLCVKHEDILYEINSKPSQVIDFLITTYENVVKRNILIEKAQKELQELNESLEEKVKERTIKLENEVKEKILAQKAIEHSERKFRFLFENAPDGITQIDSNGTIISSNKRESELLGYDQEFITGKHITDFSGEISKRELAKIIIRLQNEGWLEIEMLLTRKDGSFIPVWRKISAIYENGVITGAIIHTRDISQRKEAENSLKDLSKLLLEQNSDLEAFNRTVAHDLKVPVSNVISLATFLLREKKLQLDAEGSELLECVSKESNNLMNIIRELLLFSGLQKSDIKLEKLDMNEIIHSALDRMANLIEVNNVGLDIQENIPCSLGYMPWVEGIWINYISNAIKYGGAPPKIKIGCDCDDSGNKNGQIKFWVKDNGKGISEEDQKFLFKRFERLDRVDNAGHGLGLSIVQRIVDKLGGESGVESELGKGSKFYFTLPVV